MQANIAPTEASIAIGQVWIPRKKSEMARTITKIDGHYDLIFYEKANGWPHFASPVQFQKWAKRVGAMP